MIFVEIKEEFDQKIDASPLQDTAQKALAALGKSPDQDIQIIIADDESLQNLNNEFMGIDAPTDVLTFPLDFDNPESGTVYLGDIIISYPQAERQAQQAGHQTLEEIKLLIVHGILHLLGHDHAEPEEKEKMWSLQNSLLEQLNIKATPTE
jgi:probable rRNA maturation factor